jgi:hypothetical protein
MKPVPRREGRNKLRFDRSGTPFTDQHFNFIHELRDVFELTVYGGESHIGHLIELIQFRHHLFADHARLYFSLASLLNTLFDPVGDRL